MPDLTKASSWSRGFVGTVLSSGGLRPFSMEGRSLVKERLIVVEKHHGVLKSRCNHAKASATIGSSHGVPFALAGALQHT